jgi:NADPH:quinone reductase-like Zn-dependent oxidoreductase
VSDGERRMRAVRFHEYGDHLGLKVEEVPRPAPKPGEVLIRVRAAGVNAIDWMFRAGYLKDFMPLELPHILGIDVAGTVEGIGPDLTDFSAGDDVFGQGTATYAEYATATVGNIDHKPDSLTFEEAATLALGGVAAWAGLFGTANLEAGQRLLVHGGAGGVGSLAVQLGHWKGARVVATTSTNNVDFVRSLGADEVIDYTTTRFEDVVGDVDVVYDAVGGEVTDRSWGVLKPGGILIAAASRPEPEKAAARGVRTSGVQAPPVTRPILKELVQLIESGHLTPHVGQVFPLDSAADAHAVAQSRHGRGRIVLQVSS